MTAQNNWVISVLNVLILSADLAITFNTAYFCEEQGLVRDKTLIARKYLSFWFLPDLFWCLPVHSFFLFADEQDKIRFNVHLNYLNFLHCMQVTRLLRLWNLETGRAGRFFAIKDKFQVFFYTVFTMIFIHIATCVWIYTGLYQREQYSENWIVDFTNDPNNPVEVYFNSLYFMFMTVTSIGYGSYVNSRAEMIFIVFIELVGVIGYAALQGLLIERIQALDAKQAKIEE